MRRVACNGAISSCSKQYPRETWSIISELPFYNTALWAGLDCCNWNVIGPCCSYVSCPFYQHTLSYTPCCGLTEGCHSAHTLQEDCILPENYASCRGPSRRTGLGLEGKLLGPEVGQAAAFLLLSDVPRGMEGHRPASELLPGLLRSGCLPELILACSVPDAAKETGLGNLF